MKNKEVYKVQGSKTVRNMISAALSRQKSTLLSEGVKKAAGYGKSQNSEVVSTGAFYTGKRVAISGNEGITT